MKRASGLLVAALALGRCGASNRGPMPPPGCTVAVTGAPHAGTYASCALAGKPGGYTLTLGMLPSCAECGAVVRFDAARADCTDTMVAYVQVIDTAFVDAASMSAATSCPVVTTSCATQRPTTCAVRTAKLDTSDPNSGHWSGTVDAHVAEMDANGVDIGELDVRIAGSF